ncbi:MAG: hypothetical protein K8R58_09685, partial [Bacteroidales bacterium]|nr:hypothetical protein [Bacteroidales bacterium]
MERIIKNIFKFLFLFIVLSIVWGFTTSIGTNSNNIYNKYKFLYPPDSIPDNDTTTIPLPYPFEDESIPYTGTKNSNGLFLKKPSNITSDVEYDPKTNEYIFKSKIGEFDYRNPSFMTLDEYREYELQNSIQEYWKERAKAAGMGTRSGIIPSIY